MATVLVTEPAKQHVRDILSDLNQRAGYAIASRYAVDFKAAYRALAQFPGSGPPRPALGPNARIKIVYPYVIVYDHEGDTAMVLRVLHGRREITIKLIAR